MPKIEFANRIVECQTGENLRSVLMRNGLPLYNGIARAIHCRGLGTCGTCSVEVDGAVSEKTRIEKWRLSFPPHTQSNSESFGLRLACQCKVIGNLKLTKHVGMWGNRTKPLETS